MHKGCRAGYGANHAGPGGDHTVADVRRLLPLQQASEERTRDPLLGIGKRLPDECAP